MTKKQNLKPPQEPPSSTNEPAATVLAREIKKLFELRIHVGEKLAKERKSRKVTQAQLAASLGTNKKRIMMLETGRCNNLDLIGAYCLYFSIPITDVFKGFKQ